MKVIGLSKLILNVLYTHYPTLKSRLSHILGITFLNLNYIVILSGYKFRVCGPMSKMV